MFNFLEISERATRISISNSCLSIQCSASATSVTHSFNDLHAIILSNPAVSMSGHVLSECGKHRIPIVSCDVSYSPVAVLTPVRVEGAEQDSLLEAQISASKPFRKRLWKHVILSKLLGQAHVLLKERMNDSLCHLRASITSGDSGNIEARAARIYWKCLSIFPKRDRFAQDANVFLNYGYSVVFSAFARYLCAMAFHPHIGIHHHNQYNPFCLASDLMEPFRPAVDLSVLALLGKTDSLSLSSQNKDFLIRSLYDFRLPFNDGDCLLFAAIRRTALSFRQCLLNGNPDLIALPKWTLSEREM